MSNIVISFIKHKSKINQNILIISQKKSFMILTELFSNSNYKNSNNNNNIHMNKSNMKMSSLNNITKIIITHSKITTPYSQKQLMKMWINFISLMLLKVIFLSFIFIQFTTFQ